MSGRWGRLVAAVAVTVALAALAACSSDNGASITTTTGSVGPAPGDCISVDMAVSPEKITLLTELAKTFNEDSANQVNGKCVFVTPRRYASGGAAQLLVDGWPDTAGGPKPVVWSPAASGWGAIVNQRLSDKGEPAIAPPNSRAFMLTPLVIAMPKPMADASGYPAKPIGFADIVALANDPQGWAKYGHPEWGAFRLGKTNPNFSTSGLNFTVAEYYAATGKNRGLTTEDLQRPEVATFAKSVEQCVVHYGDTTLTFLNNLFRADERGTALTYASAVAVEEKSIVDYNAGNPDGILDAGETPRPPRIPLVAIYPSEGTLYSDNPLITLDAPWVTPEQKQGAALFETFVLRPENQSRVLQFGFRPGNTSVALGAPIDAANGLDPNQPQAVLEVPAPPVLTGVLDAWDVQRKGARVLLVMDVSGSMGDPAGSGSGGATKLDLAKQAAVAALDQFNDNDEVGLRIFSTDLGGNSDTNFLDLVPTAAMSAAQREALRTTIEGLFPQNATPLYIVTGESYQAALAAYEPTRINAVVLLTDGKNDDGVPNDDNDQLEQLLTTLRAGSEGAATRPVRVFPIAYGSDADITVLRRIAEATNAAAYDASNPATINQVFTAVVSNF